MKSLLIEIGSEEIPARFISKGLALLHEGLVKLFNESSIVYGSILEYSTPRRLTLFVDNVAEQQDDRTIESLGPPKKAAYTADGKPTKAATGFAGSLNIDVKDLKIKKTDRGEYVSATVEEKGLPTAEVLSQALPKLISSLQLPKAMRWGDSSLKYFRPIQWILALFGREVIPCELDSIKSSNVSYGHRFLSPDPIRIDDPSSYISSLKKQYVIADFHERRNTIADGIRALESVSDCRVHKDDSLLDTVTNLVEYPTAVLGVFDEKYLVLPKELLVTVMKAHQKYFSMEDSEGLMKSSFIVVSNMNKDISPTVKRGAERVLRARLEDARFYFIEDQKIALKDHIEGLKKVTFQEKLGSLYEKMERVSSLASYLSDQLQVASKEKARQASMLCKADLVTGVVGEFPELQGYMGMIYAGNSGEEEDIATAIYEHYLPRFAGDTLPASSLGIIVSIADKMDNIASFFHLDLIPTGSEDPFALRRQAGGIISILQDNEYELVLDTLINTSLAPFKPDPDSRKKCADRILRFFHQRLEGIVQSRGYSHDIISAVLASGAFNLKDIKYRLQAMNDLKKIPSFPALLTASKRVYNIVSASQSEEIKESLLREPAEKDLFITVQKIKSRLHNSEYHALCDLEVPINTFFDSVLVMDKDPVIKANRMALLFSVKRMFDTLGDFSKILEQPL